jgi:hypothetical protein
MGKQITQKQKRDKLIRISAELRAELKTHGLKGESYEDVIWRLVRLAKTQVPQ